MRTFTQVAPLRTYLRGIRGENRTDRNEGKTVGFVPTMGALHEGHLSLMRRARADCDFVIVSLFVNPMQFGPNEDYTAYPRDLNRDLQLTANVGVDAIFTPDAQDMYPPDFQTVVDVPELARNWEGAVRPGHFRGVATVVTKLLNIVTPDRAYFGQKDYQQLLIVEQLVRDLCLPVVVVAVPTLREPNGLAMSSRNAYLSPEERQAAAVLSRALQRAESLVEAGATDAESILHEVESVLAGEPLAHVDYVALASPETLAPVTKVENMAALLALAVRIGKTRLIDNILLAPPGVPLPRQRVK